MAGSQLDPSPVDTFCAIPEAALEAVRERHGPGVEATELVRSRARAATAQGLRLPI